MCSRGAVNRMKMMGLTREEMMDALQNGLPEERIRAFNDAQMNSVIELAHKMEKDAK